MSTSLILPCYNPQQGWEQNVCASYKAFCAGVTDKVELIIVMDGKSETVTAAATAFLEANVHQLKIVQYDSNKGKGYALRKGVAAATGDIILYTDIDFPYTIDSMIAVYDGLNRNEYEVGIGVKNDAYYAHVPFLRRVISRFLRVLIKMFLSMPVTDTQCGLKGFRQKVAPLFLETKIDRYLFDLEFVHKCFKSKKYTVMAIPVQLNENVRFRSMDYRILLPEMANFIKLLFD
jgi:glycosyltransferase involved in cell wall biosynthesis